MAYIAIILAALFPAFALAQENAMGVTSAAFESGAPIPERYSCDGENISPALTWQNAPADAKSFALIVEDPDAPSGTVTHWVAYNIPASRSGLDEGPRFDIPQGLNENGDAGYMGPCPPVGDGKHRYYFRVYALDSILDLPENPTKDHLDAAMQDHILAQGELMGIYERR